MKNKIKTTKRIFNSKCAKYLLKEGHEVLDLEILNVDENGDEEFCFVFKHSQSLEESLTRYTQNKRF